MNVHGERAAVVLSAKAVPLDHLLAGKPWDDDLVEAIDAHAKAPAAAPVCEVA